MCIFRCEHIAINNSIVVILDTLVYNSTIVIEYYSIADVAMQDESLLYNDVVYSVSLYVNMCTTNTCVKKRFYNIITPVCQRRATFLGITAN